MKLITEEKNNEKFNKIDVNERLPSEKKNTAIKEKGNENDQSKKSILINKNITFLNIEMLTGKQRSQTFIRNNSEIKKSNDFLKSHKNFPLFKKNIVDVFNFENIKVKREIEINEFLILKTENQEEDFIIEFEKIESSEDFCLAIDKDKIKNIEVKKIKI